MGERSRAMLLLGEAWLLEYRLRRDHGPIRVVIAAMHRRMRRQRKALGVAIAAGGRATARR